MLRVMLLTNGGDLAQRCLEILQLTNAIAVNEEPDIGISILYKHIIREPLLHTPPMGWLNFHPAPLPDYRGFAPYTFGILNQEHIWATTCHFIDKCLDTGDIVAQLRFPINPDRETALSLRAKSHMATEHLFAHVISMLQDGKPLPRSPQGIGRTFTKKQFEDLRLISPTDLSDITERKRRAFYCPPFEGVRVI